MFNKLLILFLLVVPLNLWSTKPTRGVRNFNPGNIKPKDWKVWPKAIGIDEQGHLIFRNHIDGIRAIVINLKLYKKKHNIQTVDGIINRWVDELPPKERQPYIDFVSYRLGVNRHAKLNLEDPVILKSLTKAIVTYENGFNPYDENTYKKIFPHT